MNRIKLAVIGTALAAGVLVLSGCTGAEKADADAEPKVWGYVASADAAQLSIDEDQIGADELVVDRVLAPGDAWIVVHADDDGKPGMRIGLERISKGESTDVKVELDDVTTDKVIVAVHADRGTNGEFDFDMMKKEMSPDRPYFVDEKELAAVVTVRD